MDITTIHEKWQRAWTEAKINEANVDSSKPKYFLIWAYPGISGYLHVGHMRGYTYTDMWGRYKRMTGHNVLLPVGTHASGIPTVGFAKKVRDGLMDEYLIRNGCPKEKIPELGEANAAVEFFNKVYQDHWRKLGFLCDWRRFTCTTWPDYGKFIKWQFQRLQDKNLLIQKPYYATYCPEMGPVAVDPSETDLSKGGNAQKLEYVALKFKFGDAYIVAATLRPETVFGQTNLWANPDATYVKADVNGETWIMSAEAAEKLAYQKDNVMVVAEMSGRELLGKTAIAPMIGKEIPILPATFCDPDVGTGLVTCVPSDAPYDYVALRDLQQNPDKLKQYDLNPELANLELIPIIESKGYGEFPAKEIVEKMGITSQEDEKLEEATKEIYKVGFHKGKMRSNAGKYAGKSVEEAKELIKAAMLESNEADIFHDLSEEVISRAGKRVVIKRLDNQWFIRYSDNELTTKAAEHGKNMWIYPADFRRNFPNIVEWFTDRACARQGSWLGTRLPFDEEWIVEPIADSTIYPLYYLVSPYVNDGRIREDELTNAFFDYVMLGEGKAENEHWESVRKEVEYWYPLDLNTCGVDHRTVHLPVFVMNHVGLFPESMWPKGMQVSAFMLQSTGKISKSKGGAEPIPGAIGKYGVDTIRMYYALIGAPDTQIYWEEDRLIQYKNLLERLYKQAEEHQKLNSNEYKPIDDWLLSRLHSTIKSVTESMEGFDMREATTQIYYAMQDNLKWYERRCGNNKETIRQYYVNWLKLMAPFTPHIAEEMWALYGQQGLVSVAQWPNADEDNIHPSFEAGENLIQSTIEDVRQVLKLAKIEKPSELLIFVTAPWKSLLYNDIKKAMANTRNMGEILREILNDERKEHGKEISKIVGMMIKDQSKMPLFVLERKQEYKILDDCKGLLEEEFGCTVKLVKAEASKEAKASAAAPGKPAILVR